MTSAAPTTLSRVTSPPKVARCPPQQENISLSCHAPLTLISPRLSGNLSRQFLSRVLPASPRHLGARHRRKPARAQFPFRRPQIERCSPPENRNHLQQRRIHARARKQRCVFWVIDGRHDFRIRQIGCARFCMATTPWHRSGRKFSSARISAKSVRFSNSNPGGQKPSRSRPARARIIASQSLSINLRKRVGTFPRNPTIRAAGLIQRACLSRRTLPVAIVTIGLRAALFLSNKSSTAPRSKTAVIVSSSPISLGQSVCRCALLHQCVFSVNARSNSAVKIPLRPRSEPPQHRSIPSKSRIPLRVL